MAGSYTITDKYW